MIENYFTIMAFFRSLVYSSIIISSLLVFASYKKAYYKQKKTWIIQSIMLLFLSIAFSYFFYLITCLINLSEGVSLKYRILVSFLALTNIPLLISIINFWNASLYQKSNKKRRVGKDNK